ncbi:MAG: hypothetical protein H6598_09580 [Flavobacteriales bacterium]|nr:hypothetical protein [Flavobacteriales bacterium]
MKKVIRLESEFKSLIEKADEILVAVAMLSDYGLSVFDDRDKNCNFQILVGYDLPTQPSALQSLLNNGLKARIYDVKKQFFHPKLYLFRLNQQWTAFVGSGNCTKGGLNSNIELNIRIEEDETIEDLRKWFNTYFKLGTELTQQWLNDYKVFFNDVSERNKELEILTDQFKLQTGVSKGNLSLKDYNFTNQFFGFKHYDAFTPPKPIQDDIAAIQERHEVSKKLIELHELLYPVIQKNNWDIYPHHQEQHITSSYFHHERVSKSLTEIWLHYGRSEEELEVYKKEFGENMTSLFHMRMEVLIGKDCLYSELRVGKKDGSYPDREYIKDQLKNNPTFSLGYYKYIQQLDPDFSVTINGDSRLVTSFRDAEELRQFTLQDNIRHYYFSIGRTYLPDDPRISNSNVVQSIIGDFTQLYPLYQLFKHTF